METWDIPELELTLAEWRKIAAASGNKALQDFLNSLEGLRENDPFSLVPARSDWLLRLVNDMNEGI